MKILDIPKKCNENTYHKVIDKQITALSKIEGVKTIYQIGGLSTPGISDIDLVVIFKDGCRFDFNPRINNDGIGNYLFTHGLYGASQTHFYDSLKYTFFHNFKWLHGENLDLKNSILESEKVILKEQIALEFLFKMYINLAVQHSYNTIKLRSLFLHIKALLYDFEFLNITPLKLIGRIEEGIAFRNNWFDGNVSKKEITVWFKLFFMEFETFLVSLFQEYNLYAQLENFKIAQNIEIWNAAQLSFDKNGIIFPNPLNLLNKKYFNLLNRINDFKFQVPLKLDAPDIINDYFKYIERTSSYNKVNLPFFMPLTSSLKAYN